MYRLRRVPRLLPGTGRAGAIGGRRSKAGSRLAAAGRGTLTGAALLLAATVALTAYYMIVLTDFDGFGILGFIALTFPLHLLAVAIVAAALGLLTWRCGAVLSTTAFALVAVLTAIMALWPSLAIWQRARDIGVSLSLAEYSTNALRPNAGGSQPEQSVPYRTAPDGTSLELDVWRAATAAGDAVRPAMVRVHGGAWVHGERGDLGEWDRWLSELGYVVFDIEYRLTPPERWRDQVGDVKCALGWVVAHAAEYRIDPARIGIMGHSAGSHLAMLAAYSMGDRQLPASCDSPAVPIKAVVNFYGPVDLVVGYDDSGSLAFAQDALRQFIGGSPAAYPERYRTASPASHIGADTPPTITLLGESDRIVSTDQARILDAALARAGVYHETYLLPVTDHAFDLNWGGFGTQIARAKLEHFLRQHL
jgi:acetyl esterase/lipase